MVYNICEVGLRGSNYVDDENVTVEKRRTLPVPKHGVLRCIRRALSTVYLVIIICGRGTCLLSSPIRFQPRSHSKDEVEKDV